jgi:hypothetical protein
VPVSLQGKFQEAIAWLERDFNNVELQNTAITSVYLAQAKLRTGDIERGGKMTWKR